MQEQGECVDERFGVIACFSEYSMRGQTINADKVNVLCEVICWMC